MAQINDYIRSLPGIARRKIENILSSGPSLTISSSSGSINTITSDAQANTVVTNSRINAIYGGVANKTSAMWDSVNAATSYVSWLAGTCDAVTDTTSRSLIRTKASLEALMASAARSETIDVMYVEVFSDTSGSDADLTNAEISNGYLVLPLDVDTTPTGAWSLAEATPSGAEVSCDTVTGAFNAVSLVPTSTPTDDPLTVTVRKTLDVVSPVTSVRINIGDCTLTKIRITDGTTVTYEHDLDIDVTGQTKVDVSFPRVDAKTIEIGATKSHYTISSTAGSGSTSAIEPIISIAAASSPVGDLNITNLKTVADLKSAILATTTMAAGTYTEYSISCSSIEVHNLARRRSAIWVSSPVEIEGDVRKISLLTKEGSSSEGNVRWSLSFEGRPWTPIVPINGREISGEILNTDFSGMAMLHYPANKNYDINIQGLPTGATVDHIPAQNGDIVGVRVSKAAGCTLSISYTTSYSGIVDATAIGLASNDIKVIDATTNGKLGEHFTKSDGSTVMLSHQPHGSVDVYVNGVLAIQLDDDRSLADPTLDPTLVYCKVVGRSIQFAKTMSNVSVYYKYAQTTIRFKAYLESVDNDHGKTPMIDAISAGVKIMTI